MNDTINITKEMLIDKYKNVQFPPKIILFIPLHGDTEFTREKTYQDFPVPENMTITRFSGSTLGESFYMLDEKDPEYYKKVIEDNMFAILHSRHIEAQKVAYEKIEDDIKSYIDKNVIPHLLDDIKDLRKEKTEESITKIYEIKRFIAVSNKAYQLNKFTYPDRMINKIFGIHCTENLLSNKLLILNVAGQPNLLAGFTRKRNIDINLGLNTIVDFLFDKNVSELIFFDFSCSDTIDAETNLHISDRTLRQKRREISVYDPITKKLKSTMGGRKAKKQLSKKYRKKTKSAKYH